MGRTVSGRDFKAGKEEYASEYYGVLLATLANGKRVPKTKSTISVSGSLLSKTASKARIVSHDQVFAPLFKKYAGKKAPTAEIFAQATGKSLESDNELSA